MKRTQIYINEELHQQAVLLAQAKGVSMAQLIREYLKEGIKKQKKIDYSGKKVMEEIAKLNIKGGPKDLSINHDYYLYGAPKKT